MLAKEAVDQYKEIYRRKFGIELTDLEATKQAHELINIMKVLYKKPLDASLERGEDCGN